MLQLFGRRLTGALAAFLATFLAAALLAASGGPALAWSGAPGAQQDRVQPQAQTRTVLLSQLPEQARETLALIKAGGPFPYKKDGTVFGNYERLLPRQKRGYYSEYTVRTPGVKGRGPARIVAGKGATGDPATSGEYWFTGDHYKSFRRIEEDAPAPAPVCGEAQEKPWHLRVLKKMF
ncbi:MAG: ribonuclease [Duodenibacillus sp.]|nr:ribonuclease [Duodenibacillus sp.]